MPLTKLRYTYSVKLTISPIIDSDMYKYVLLGSSGECREQQHVNASGPQEREMPHLSYTFNIYPFGGMRHNHLHLKP